MQADCYCRDCSGNPCLCSTGDHCDYKGPHCSCCGDTNYAWLGYLGARSRWAKARGRTVEEWEVEYYARAEAAALGDEA